MKKQFLILFSIILFFISMVNAQTITPDILNLNTPETGTSNIDRKARKEVNLQQGYETNRGNRTVHIYLDEAATGPTNYAGGGGYTNSNFPTDVNTSMQVGAIPGSAGVNLMGSANYTIPIEISPGTAGMQPNLSISYNSMGGDGFMGIGWNFNGISYISRTNKNVYYDGIVDDYKFQPIDQYVLDGDRLIVVEAGSVFYDRIYKTDEDNQIITKPVFKNGFDGFISILPNGNIIEYGLNFSSRLIGGSFGSPLMWYISKVIDVNGNYVEYNYTNDAFGYRINNIQYSGNELTGLKPYNKIQFEYNDRVDKTFKVYADGVQLNCNNLLTAIKVTSNNELVNRYQFEYSLEIHSKLKQVKMYGSSNTLFSTTSFLYHEKPVNTIEKTNNGVQRVFYNNTNDYSEQLITGDFNGDGFTDLMLNEKWQRYNAACGCSITNNYDYTVLINNKNNGFIPNPIIDVDLNTMHIVKVNHSTKVNLNSDFDGNGEDELLIPEVDECIDGDKCLNSLWSYRYNESEAKFIKESYFIVNGPRIPYNDNNFINISDFDGDGISDFLVFTKGSSFFFELFSPKNSGRKNRIVFPANQLSNNEIESLFSGFSKIYTFDYNGDKKSDLIIVGQNSTKIFTLESFAINSTSNVNANLMATIPINYNDFVQFGDFNGDGKTDFIYSDIETKSNGEKWSENFKIIYFIDNSNYGYWSNYDIDFKHESGKNMILGDFNSDGTTDILIPDLSYRLGTNKGTKIIKFDHNFKAYITTSDVEEFENNSDIAIGDFNGDGLIDFIKNETQNGFDYYYTFTLFKENKEFYLHKVVDGMGITSTFEYSWFPKVGNRTGLAYSGNHLPFVSPILVTTSFKQSNGVGGENEMQYKYYDPSYNSTGRGFLGYSKVEELDLTNNSKIISEFEKNTTFFVVKPFRTTVEVGGETINRTTNTYEWITRGSKRYWAKLTSINEENLLFNKNTITNLEYDNDLNIISKEQNFGSLGIEKSEYTYGHKCTTCEYNNAVTKVKTRRSVIGQSEYIREVNTNFYSNGLIRRKISDPGTSNQITVEFVYDQYGNIITENTKSVDSNLPTFTNTFSYDNNGRFLKTSTNSLGQTSYIEREPLWGNVILEKGIDGLTVRSEYDAYGRLNKKTDALGNTVTLTTEWDVNNNIPINGSYNTRTLYKTKVEKTASATTYNWYDAFGRVTKATSTNYNNETILGLVAYNEKGQKTVNTLPFINDNPVLNFYEYDQLGRLIKSENTEVGQPSTIKYEYDAGEFLVEVTKPSGEKHLKRSDYMGRTLKAIDNGGELEYLYNSIGMVGVKLNGMQVSTISYDDFGRQTTLFDKNAGTTSYAYNAMGWLSQQTDNKGNVTTLSYDNVGRVKQKNTIEGLHTYTYVAQGNGINNVEKITAPDGFSTEYEYDVFGRVKLHREVYKNGEQFDMQYSYDILGRLEQMQYPSGLEVNYGYNENSYTNHISSPNIANTNLFEPIQQNENGQYTQYKLGNDLVVHNTYNKLGYLQEQKAGNIFNYQYSHDIVRQNLNSRKNVIHNLFEQFGYDNLDRLTAITPPSANVPAIQTNYDAKGNITLKNDAGVYQYDANKINAITQISNPSSNISDAEQNISYNSYHQAYKITENDVELEIQYGTDQQRRISQWSYTQTPNIINKTRMYGNMYEKQTDLEGNTIEVNYINGPTGSLAMYVVENGVGNIYYTHQDHLGSILALSKQDGTIAYEQSFDAWGRERNPTNWTYTALPQKPEWLWRGYTGHEHLPEFGLINMNGRMYDPVLGRMLSPDNYVQAPDFTQSYNRYSYVFNNPLKYTDPTGEYSNFVYYKTPSIGDSWNLPSKQLAENLYEKDIRGGGGGGGNYGGGGTANNFGVWAIKNTNIGGQGSVIHDGQLISVNLSSANTQISGSGSGSGNSSGTNNNNNGSSGYKTSYLTKSDIKTLNGVDVTNNEVNINWHPTSLSEPTSLFEPRGRGENPMGITNWADGGSWIDNVQTGLDIAGIADPTGIVDGVNAVIYAGRGQWGNAGISALAIIPFGDVGKVGRLGAKTLQLTSKARTAEKGLEIGGRFLGNGYREIAPGVFRSADNLRQFRMTDSDILNNTPHFNFEIFGPNNLRTPIKNYHMPIK
jgi:RHS repeat-associated protein